MAGWGQELSVRPLGGLGHQDDGRDRRQTIGGNGVVASMTVASAGLALFFNVADLAACRHFTIPADDAAARECGKAEKSHETHTCRKAIAVPMKRR